MFVNEEDARADGRGEAASFVPSGLVKGCPALVEYLTLDQFESGAPRSTSTLSVFIQHGALHVALVDRHFERSTFATGATLEAALLSLEGRLQTGEVEWRRWAGNPKKKRR